MKQFIGLYENEGMYYLIFSANIVYPNIRQSYQLNRYTRKDTLQGVIDDYINNRSWLYIDAEGIKNIKSYEKIDISKSYPELMI